ncbi:MAG: PEP_CTERM-anchored TLD domain-containing protein [Massilia sp.]
MKTLFVFGSLGLACALSAMPAAAGDIMLDQSTRAQLERWLGEGRLRFNNVYTRAPGDTSQDFHAAADQRGPTFVLAQLRNEEGQPYLVGGYNPQSWSSDEGWHDTAYDYQRTAFLFNFTAPAVYRQVSTSFILPSQGLRQTFNAPDYGPTFGAGHDLYFNEALDSAFSWQVSYGNPAESGASIVDRSTGGEIVKVDALAVFAISPVPEPAAWGMLLGGLGLLSLAARREPA